jgi:membrane associated rhomboid family serine protease
MTPAAVGIRCPEHAGRARTIKAPRIVARPAGSAIATKVLIALNVVVYLITAVQGNGLNNPGGTLYVKWILFGPFVAHGDWWRLVTAMFLHGFIVHIVFNMVALWYIGSPVEQYLGPLRYLLLYFVAGLAGSAGALVAAPLAPTVGASGAIFGILGAMLILEWNATGRWGGAAGTLIAINLVLDFVLNRGGGNISIGGHLGGLVGGILVMLAFARWGRGHAAYGRIGVPGVVGVVAVAAVSILVSYWKVRGLA